jgi:hypothetical protein
MDADSKAIPDYSDLPGGDLLAQGLKDLAEGKETLASLWVEIGEPRLRFDGVDVPPVTPQPLSPEIRLYRLLGATHGVDAYSQYNALLRRLSSLGRALDMRSRRGA